MWEFELYFLVEDWNCRMLVGGLGFVFLVSEYEEVENLDFSFIELWFWKC